MHITKNTDYSLRTLMLLALQTPDTLISIEEISATFNISRGHLMKIVNRLARMGLVETVRGRSGGVRLHLDHADINLGQVFRELEEVAKVVDCDDGPCLFRGACNLDRALRSATDAFLRELDSHTLADLVAQRAELQDIVMRGLSRS